MARILDVRKAPALALAFLIGALSVVVPILDRDAGHDLPAFESEGGDATCVVGHDHGICTQHGANPLAPSPAHPQGTATPFRVTPQAPRGVVLHRSLHIVLRPSRAPPAA